MSLMDTIPIYDDTVSDKKEYHGDQWECSHCDGNDNYRNWLFLVLLIAIDATVWTNLKGHSHWRQWQRQQKGLKKLNFSIAVAITMRTPQPIAMIPIFTVAVAIMNGYPFMTTTATTQKMPLSLQCERASKQDVIAGVTIYMYILPFKKIETFKFNNNN